MEASWRLAAAGTDGSEACGLLGPRPVRLTHPIVLHVRLFCSARKVLNVTPSLSLRIIQIRIARCHGTS